MKHILKLLGVFVIHLTQNPYLINAQVISPVTPGVGQYCSNYFFDTSGCEIDNYVGDSTDSQYACYPVSKCCPWNFNQGCTYTGGAVLMRRANAAVYSLWDCTNGCISASNCIAIPGATFTSVADPITNSTGCAFTCPTGQYQSGYACKSCPVCSAGSYNKGCGNTNNGTCTACPSCSNGYYRTGCAGSSPGICSSIAPLTPGVGQYCVNYFSGWNDGLLYQWGAQSYSDATDAYWVDCSYSTQPYRYNLCAGQANSLNVCPWVSGPYCQISFPYVICGDNCGLCSFEQITFSCALGCTAVAQCTIPQNAVSTGPANPITSSTGCPFQCNAGYFLNNSICHACINTS